MTSNRLRVAWFSPLNISTAGESVSAYATDELLPELRNEFEVELFHDAFDSYQDYPTFHYLSAFKRHRAKPFDLFFYQVEDLKAAYFTRIHMGLVPGVVWFHDIIFALDGPETLHESPWSHTLKIFNQQVDAWPPRTRKFSKSGPFGFRESGLAALPIFSSERGHGEYKRMCDLKLKSGAGERSYYLPLPVSDELSRIKNSGQKFRIGFAGTPRIEHRAHKFLEALQPLSNQVELIWLLAENEIAQAKALLEEFGIDDAKLVTGRSPAKWQELASGFDLGVHTLFSAYGQPGPYLAISLMLDLPCLVSSFGATEYLPPQVAFKIEAGDHETFEMREVLNYLVSNKSEVSGGLAGIYAREMHSRKIVAKELGTIFRQNQDLFKSALNTWGSLEADAMASMLEEDLAALPGQSEPGILRTGQSDAETCAEILVQPFLKEFLWSRPH